MTLSAVMLATRTTRKDPIRIGDHVQTKSSSTVRPIAGTVEAICPVYGLLVVDHDSRTYPLGGWFLAEEVSKR